MARNPLAARLREAAGAALPGGAFLRRDRGAALFVTDAPRLAPGADWPDRLAAAGFEVRLEGGRALMAPGPRWLAALEAEYPAPPDFFCAALARFAGRPPEAESLALFAQGARALDGARDQEAFDRALRRRAALCLRAGGGGGLYACALMRHLIIEEEHPHEAEMARPLLL